MSNPYSAAWDDPEEYPEDVEKGMAPQDPPNDEGMDVVFDSFPSPNWDESSAAEHRRARRRQRINDHLATQTYHKGRKEELRWERGGRYS